MFKTVTEDSIPQSSHLILVRHINEVKNCYIQLDEYFNPRKEIVDRIRHAETIEQISLFRRKQLSASTSLSNCKTAEGVLNDRYNAHEN